MENIEKKVSELVEKIISETALRLVKVEYLREGNEWYLRVYIDKDGGIEIADCVNVSKQLSKVLDEEDFIKTQYFLEVSSPGDQNGTKNVGGKN